MAKTSIEKCVQNVDNHFELVILAAQRARELHAGADPTIEEIDDSTQVTAMCEIAQNSLDIDALRVRAALNIKSESGGNIQDFNGNTPSLDQFLTKINEDSHGGKTFQNITIQENIFADQNIDED